MVMMIEVKRTRQVDCLFSVDKPGLSFEHRRQLVSTQRFTPEFKEEAVKQVVDRGYGVPEVAARLGVSAHSLYKWVKAVSPDKSEQQSKELLEAKGEILRLRAQMRRVEEERDLLKKPRGTLPRTPSEVPLHDRASA
jgi:transposase